MALLAQLLRFVPRGRTALAVLKYYAIEALLTCVLAIGCVFLGILLLGSHAAIWLNRHRRTAGEIAIFLVLLALAFCCTFHK
jgi:hypothetical protein